MSIDTNQTILPSNIGEILNQKSSAISPIRERHNAFNKSFSELYENFMSNAQALSATRFVKVFDTQGKGIGQIFKNIGHNIKALFAGNGSAEYTALEQNVSDLEQIAKTNMVGFLSDYTNVLQNLLKQVRNAKAEHLKKIKADGKLGNVEKNILILAKKADSVLCESKNESIANKYKTMMLLKGDGPFQKLAENALLIAPGDNAVQRITMKCNSLLELTEGSSVNGLSDLFTTYFEQKAHAQPTLADRLETALTRIAFKGMSFI